MLKDCKNSLKVAKAAAEKLIYLKKKKATNAVHMVLADICRQMDTHNFIDEHSDHDLKIFQGLVGAQFINITMSDDIEDIKKTPDYSSNQYCVDINFMTGTKNKFEDACVDSRAQLSCMENKQSFLYCEENGNKFSPSNTPRKYRFRDEKCSGLGVLKICLLVSDSSFAEIPAKVVNVDVPFLHGLDALTQFKALLDFGQDTVTSNCDGWTLPLVQKLGHVYIDWTPTMLYIEPELRWFHRNLYHPQHEKL